MTHLEAEKLSIVLMEHYSITENNAISRMISDDNKDEFDFRELMNVICLWNNEEAGFQSEEDYETYLNSI